ncbi:hypothetical protein F3J37_01205 [Pantoea sp. Al-1710]|uniref:Uncharacterized protein n=1 Tax=Candidatus Pantoea communis TaxID=2608354 RepID=A0ABX0RNI7_9GAMM|nr:MULTISPECIES: hypothetical protein [Pantoea]NIG13005.1 hypothetical protein [Pantoea sp. Cy-640]NIG17294.1 hypothetical protein [Pantoea communis]
MTHIEFIEDHLIKELSKLGFDSTACHIGAREGVSYFRRASQSSRKGKIFDDCLFHAKLFAKKHASTKK